MENCKNCGYWELIEKDDEVGGYGICHNPVCIAQAIVHTGDMDFDEGMQLEGARSACAVFRTSN